MVWVTICVGRCYALPRRVAFFLGLVAGTAFGQNRPGQYWSLGGFGNVLYPGTGHAPTATPPGGFNRGSHIPNGGLGRPIGNPYPVTHQQHRRTVIVPYPVYYGGYGYGYGYDPSVAYGPGYGDQQQAPAAPSVVINQNFVPPQANPVVRDYSPSDSGQDQQQSGMRLYQAPPSHPYADSAQTATQPQQPANDDQPTLYLIAFKNHNIVQALGYWMEGSTLHYVSVEHTLNQASLDLIDRDLSMRLNAERNIEFKLPQH